MGRVEQVNSLLRKELAQAVSEEVIFPDGLITVSSVDCSSDFKYAKVYVSVIPEGLFGTALAKLNKQTAIIAGSLRQRTKIRRIPKIKWVINPKEKELDEIEAVFAQIEQEREGK